MLPRRAIIIRSRVAIVLDYENKGIQLWRDYAPQSFHCAWYLDRILTIGEFAKLYPPGVLDDGVEEALTWFSLDCGLVHIDSEGAQ